MSSLWEISTDGVVTTMIAVCISALAIAWLFAGRRRPSKDGSLEQKRLAGREAEILAAPTQIAESPPPMLQETPELQHEAEPEANAPLPLNEAQQTIAPPTSAETPPPPRSAEQVSAMSITAALVRHDKRDAEPSEPPAQLLPPKPASAGGDDLTAISGIDSTLAQELNDLGIRYFDQIITWAPEHETWIASRLSSSVTSAQRAIWMAEAKALGEQPTPADRSHAERAG